jgi:transcriptional regulator with XRE-family HTH domain
VKTIRELREAQGLSQTQLACLVGTSQNHVSEWELRKKEPRLRFLQKLAAVFQVSLDDLDVARKVNMATGAEVDHAPAASF